ncbi:hypothetical protein F2Z72_19570 [Bacteroides fragilis]|nr:hypothetical protein F2042_18075 [Bacteroides fragilis]KAA4875572.1 hypothetical protein F2027_18250 [Bacteroides fragilis]KAA4890646.1 hypothetical protein F2016_18320 [Bacteroides fragilis]KAA4926389.1 hypothetical protein F2Z97_19755 [Bacteroides fragilis]KAA4970195.1 hypothetical protein F2Z91_17665 [Bacteroides fragilis]
MPYSYFNHFSKKFRTPQSREKSKRNPLLLDSQHNSSGIYYEPALQALPYLGYTKYFDISNHTYSDSNRPKSKYKTQTKEMFTSLIINILCYKNHVSKDVRFLKHYFYPSHWM